MSRFFTHGDRLRRVADGRTGIVLDIEGVAVNLIWDDDRSHEWVPSADLEWLASGPAPLC